MLGHVRSGTLDRFKDAFNNALNGGKGFAMAARECFEYFMSQFDEGSAGMISYIYNAIYIHMERGMGMLSHAFHQYLEWNSQEDSEKANELQISI